MRILLFSHSYAPEPTGIGPYSGGMASSLVKRGHEVCVIAANPSFPQWKLFEGFSAWRWSRSKEGGVIVRRTPVYVPRKVGGLTRVLHYASFVLSASPPALALSRTFKPDMVVLVAPNLLVAPLAILTAKLAGAASWLHVQDFEVEASFATGQIRRSSAVAKAALAFERRSINAFSQTSSISPEMCTKLVEKGRTPETVYQLRNWADIDAVTPQPAMSSPYRDRWGIKTPHVALYSGSIGRKQGIESLVDTARALKDRPDLTFILCGNGPSRGELEAQAEGLSNIHFFDLQPREALGDLLSLATIHLLPQKRDAADLVLPSKLTNILASGRPVIAGAAAGTGLAREVEDCGLAVEPEDVGAMAAGIERLLDDPAFHAVCSAEARRRAEQRWSREAIIDAFEAELNRVVQRGK